MKRLVLAIAVVSITTSVVGAQPKNVVPAEAERAAKEKATSAKAAFDRGDYAVAVDEYREAYRLVPSPGLLYNLGQAYRLVGACAEASDAYREYLRLVPESPYRATAEQNLAAAEVCARDAAAAAKRREETERADELTATATAPPTTAPPPPTDRGKGFRRAGVGAMAASGMLAVAGTYFAFDAVRQADEVTELYERGGAWEDIAAADERGLRSQLVSRVTFGTSAIALAAGVTLYLLGRRAEPSARDGRVMVSWRF